MQPLMRSPNPNNSITLNKEFLMTKILAKYGVNRNESMIRQHEIVQKINAFATKRKNQEASSEEEESEESKRSKSNNSLNVESEEYTEDYTEEQSRLMKAKKVKMDKSIDSAGGDEESIRSNL